MGVGRVIHKLLESSKHSYNWVYGTMNCADDGQQQNVGNFSISCGALSSFAGGKWIATSYTYSQAHTLTHTHTHTQTSIH